MMDVEEAMAASRGDKPVAITYIDGMLAIAVRGEDFILVNAMSRIDDQEPMFSQLPWNDPLFDDAEWLPGPSNEELDEEMRLGAN